MEGDTHSEAKQLNTVLMPTHAEMQDMFFLNGTIYSIINGTITR